MLLLPGAEEEEEGHNHGGEGHHHEYDLMYGSHQHVLSSW